MKNIFIKILVYPFLLLLSDSVNGQTILWDYFHLKFNSDIISHRIILIGDAGEPAKDIKEPVLISLQNEASELPDSTLVVFLGDNIYSNGLPDINHSDRKEYEYRLNEQISAIKNSNANGIFIPGNHDWKQGNDGGWQRLLNQAEYVSKYGYDKVSFAPLNGCPGPAVFDFGSKVRLIVLDTQWWFQDAGKRPEESDSLCNFCTEETVIAALDSILNDSSDKSVIIAAHHPLKTYGPHGGYFGWKDHIFPLRNLNKYLWIPLPIIGSAYPLVRGSGVSSQDLPSKEYQHLKNQLESVISKYSGIVLASGHEHTLQILEGISDNLYVVSGTGIWGHVEESLSEGDDTIFAGQHEGFVVLDYLYDGRIQLSVIKVLNESGKTQNVFSIWLLREY
jgi:hypothetical protein